MDKKITVATDAQAAIVQGVGSTASKIRNLNAMGTPKGDIARLLDIRYQWVRNVLEAAKSKKS